MMRTQAVGSSLPSPLSIITSFTQDIEALGFVRTVVLDGSVNTGEYVAGYSDIDVKVVLHPLTRWKTVTVFERLARAIRHALPGGEVVFNVWTLTAGEYPGEYPSGYFDFVRRHVLKQGRVLCGTDQSHRINVPSVMSTYERDICLAQLTAFTIRLGRLLTNPMAISDVRHPDEVLYCQQAIAYYFHSLRYLNAYLGKVMPSIQGNVALLRSAQFGSHADAEFASLMLGYRQGWPDVCGHGMRPAMALLGKVIDAIRRMRASMLAHIGRRCVPIEYYSITGELCS